MSLGLVSDKTHSVLKIILDNYNNNSLYAAFKKKAYIKSYWLMSYTKMKSASHLE